VKNRSGGVLIEIEGEHRALDLFLQVLTTSPPPLARIERLRWDVHPPRRENRFRIEESGSDVTVPIFRAPDVATCPDCLEELFNPLDRRYLYAFLNCTNCGPRFTIITSAQYDRSRTTMASFVMCEACRAEYEDLSNRRFHAEPIACPACGPRLRAVDRTGGFIVSDDPLAVAIDALFGGKIVAIKGLGGYHLACLADDERAVRKLRRRKHRDEKPFALMVRGLEEARTLAEVSETEESRLVSKCRPIVLLRRRASADVAESVAPESIELGVMLPYTPLHHLLFQAFGSRALVMTSGNRSDEPIAYRDEEARARLAGIADLILTHDRPIHIRCDDSVTRVVDRVELPIRRSRGESPAPIPLPFSCPRPILAVGGQLKSTFALGRERMAILSHHLGDLDHYEAYRSFVEAIGHY
jgi:hydrogenase maturation protein HypF